VRHIDYAGILENLFRLGFTPWHFRQYMVRRRTPEQEAYVECAKNHPSLGIDLEVDDNAEVSEGDGGAFVQAWLWIDKTAIEEE